MSTCIVDDLFGSLHFLDMLLNKARLVGNKLLTHSYLIARFQTLD